VSGIETILLDSSALPDGSGHGALMKAQHGRSAYARIMLSPRMRKLASSLTQESFFAELICFVLFRRLRRCLFLLPNTLSCLIHCNRRRFLVRSRRHKSSDFKIVQRLRPNPHQLVSPNGKANCKERSQRERADSQSDDSCNFHDLSCEACCPYVD
jgi:hypothetical protein